MINLLDEHLSEIITALVAILGIITTFVTGYLSSLSDKRKQQRQYLSSIYFPLIEKLSRLQFLLKQKNLLIKKSDESQRISYEKDLDDIYEQLLVFFKSDYQSCGYFLHKKLTQLYIYILNEKYSKKYKAPLNQVNQPNIQRIIMDMSKNVIK